MTPAQLEEVVPDPGEARRLATQAQAHLRSANVAAVDAESAYGLCYQAALKACIASLTAAGLRATGGASGHVVVLREAATRLALPGELVDRLDAMRRTRHRVFYGGVEVSELELDGARRDAQAVVERVLEAL